MRWRNLVPLFAFGAIVLSFFDGFHTYSGTTAYADPILLRMAWWTPLLFGTSLAGGGALFTVLYQRLGGAARPSRVGIAAGFLVFGGLYFTSAFLPAGTPTKAAVISAAAAGLWLWLDRTWQGAALAVVTAIAGCSVEITLSSIGAFYYLRPDHLGIPVWLPALYLASAAPVGHLTRRALLPQSAAESP